MDDIACEKDRRVIFLIFFNAIISCALILCCPFSHFINQSLRNCLLCSKKTRCVDALQSLLKPSDSSKASYTVWRAKDAPSLTSCASSKLILNPDILEGKIFDLASLPLWKRLMLRRKIINQHTKDNAFTASHFFEHQQLSLVTLRDDKIAAQLEAAYAQGRTLPKIYLLDDLFFQALLRSTLPLQGWIFVLREDDSNYALACYHKKMFQFKRVFPKTARLVHELQESLTYLKRFGYKESIDASLKSHMLQVFCFSNAGIQPPELETIAWRRIPFDQDQVIYEGMKSRKKMIFRVPHKLFSAHTFTFLKKVALSFTLPFTCLATVFYFSALYVFDTRALQPLYEELEQAKKLPNDYALFHYLDQRQENPFKADFLGTLSSLMKDKQPPYSIDVTRATAGNDLKKANPTLKLSFQESFHGQSFEAMKKKLSNYHMAVAHKTLTLSKKTEKAPKGNSSSDKVGAS